MADDPKSEEEEKRDELQDDVYAFDENWKQQHLWKISLTGQSEERITEGDFANLSYRLSRDGEQIVVQRAPSPLLDDSFEGEVWILDAAGHNWRQLTDNTDREFGAELSPDGSAVLFQSRSNGHFEPYYNDNLFVVPATGGPHRLLLQEMPYAVQQAHWFSSLCPPR